MTHRKVLIADDSMFMRNNLKQILLKFEYDVIGEAKDGRDAVELYKKYLPDIVSLDITMPNLDGIGALKQIKAINKDAKVVICSSMGQKYYIEEAMENGAADFIVKPFNVEKVIETFRKLDL